jgi:uncharacterized membrane protein
VKARVAFVASLPLYAGVVLWAWTTFPDRVPVHWGGGGDADRVVSRDRAATLLLLTVIVVQVGLVADDRPRDTP